MTIGERLEEARKRKGVSVREAAEATKIRGDFLLAMENNSFDINLPEIYTKGFLKIYATFLKLDVEKVVTDYEALRLGGRKPARGQTLAPQNASMQPPKREPAAQSNGAQQRGGQGNGRASFGRMEIGGDGSPAAADAQAAARPQPSQHSTGPDDVDGDRALYIKVGIGVAAVVVAIVLVVVAFSVFGHKKPALNPDLATRNASTATAGAPVELIATDNVGVMVIQKSDTTTLWSGTLMAGERKTVDAKGPVEVRYTNGANLTVERRGVRTVMTTTGPGRSSID